MMETQLFVVPKSIPITFPIIVPVLVGAAGKHFEGTLQGKLEIAGLGVVGQGW
jgi:hypothetical protein